jgi:hypothetical protein
MREGYFSPNSFSAIEYHERASHRSCITNCTGDRVSASGAVDSRKNSLFTIGLAAYRHLRAQWRHLPQAARSISFVSCRRARCCACDRRNIIHKRSMKHSGIRQKRILHQGWGEILELEASSYLTGVGLRSSTDIPALKELEEWFDAQKEIRMIAKLDPFFERSSKLASRRAQTRNRAARNARGVCARAGSLSLKEVPSRGKRL